MSSPKFPTDIAGNPKLERLVSSGGVALWPEALRRGKVLRQLLFSVAGQQDWTDGQMIITVMLLNMLGYDRVADVEDLERDPGLRRLIRRQEPSVLGINQKRLKKRFRQKGGRQRAFPSESSLHDWLARFEDEEAGQKRVVGQAVVPRPAAALDLIDEVNRRLARLLMGMLKLKRLTLDIDATVVALGKRDALPIYRSALGSAAGERGYQPLQVFCPKWGMVLGNGHVPASVGNLSLVKKVMSDSPLCVEGLTLRSDSAGYPHELMQFCQSPESREEELRRVETSVIHDPTGDQYYALSSQATQIQKQLYTAVGCQLVRGAVPLTSECARHV